MMKELIEKLNGMSINLNNGFLTKKEFIDSIKLELYKILFLGFTIGLIFGVFILRLLQVM